MGFIPIYRKKDKGWVDGSSNGSLIQGSLGIKCAKKHGIAWQVVEPVIQVSADLGSIQKLSLIGTAVWESFLLKEVNMQGHLNINVCQ